MKKFLLTALVAVLMTMVSENASAQWGDLFSGSGNSGKA